jgi:VIT1/CCC1 family predicted Fe2+/Mn2+ transporter
MRALRRFVDVHVEPADRLAEMIFGLVMALGVTGAIRLGATRLDSRELFVSVLGCNIAWGIVDGVVIVLMRLFERGRIARVVRNARAAVDEDAAVAAIANEVDSQITGMMTPDERSQFRRLVLSMLGHAHASPVGLQRGDLVQGAAAGLLVILPTLPVVLPYLVFSTPVTAVRVSSAVALVLLFMIGVRWGRIVGGRGWRIGGSLALLGIALVAITIALGG